MTKGEKGMGETLKRVAKECQNDAIRTQMNKIKKLSMWLMKKSRKVVSVSTSMKDECVRYAARPLALHNICLAEFAVMYDVIQSSTKTEETEDVNTEEEMQNIENANPCTKMKLQKGLGVIRKRKQEAILCTRRYKIHAEPEKYYHAKLLLYYPWNSHIQLTTTHT